MLFLYRGVSKGYSFHLHTEMKAAGKFDDLVFEYTHNGKKLYRLLQAKHKLDESQKIKAHNLLEEKNGNYNLIKYCRSYVRCKRNNLFKDGSIKDVIICTNIDFDLENLNREKIQVEKIEDEDDILDVAGRKKQPQRYRISQDLATSGKISEFSLDEVKDFLDHLVFAVNQPNEEELEIIIKEELGDIFDLDSKTKEDVYNELFQKMLKLPKRKDRFFSYEEGKKFFEETKRGMPIWFGARHPVESFFGRDEQLKNLHKMLQIRDANVVSKVVSISGLGGIGKSELVRKYINKHSQDYDKKVVWLNAENYQSLADCFRRLACDHLGKRTKNANGEEKPIKSIVEYVHQFFAESKSLFVFDNAEKHGNQDDFHQGIHKFLFSQPANRENRPHIIITSRNQKWPKHIKVLILEVFTEEEAVQFIKNSLNIENNAQEKEIFELSKELQYFPLALQQAVSYIRVKNDEMKNVNSSFQISDYLEKFKEKAKELLDFEFPEDSDNEYTKTTYITWNVTLDAIKKNKNKNGDVALEILNIISYLAPENIPVELLFNLAHDKEKLGSAIELLKQHSMVNLESRMLNIHRLVQYVTRIKLKNQKKEEDALRSVLALFKDDKANSKIVDHMIIAWNYSSKYNKLIEEFPCVSSYISNELINSGKYEEAHQFGLKVLESFKPLSLDNPLIQAGLPVTENNIAAALLKLGKCDSALEMFEKIFDRYQKISLPSHHPAMLRTKANIALTKGQQGKYDEALMHYKEIKKIKKETLGDVNHHEILSTKQNITQIFLAQGKYNKALRKFKKLQSIQNATLGEKHEQSLKTRTSIGDTLLCLNQCDEALEKFEEVLEIQKKNLKEDHPDILTTRTKIAGVLLKQCKYNDAYNAYQDMLTIKRKSLKENHPDVLRIRYHLAEIQRLESKYEEALEAFRENFKQERNILGDDHPDTLTTQYSLAFTLDNQGNHTEALKVFEEVLKKREVIFESDHIDTLKVRNQIAIINSKQGSYDKAFQMYQEIFAVQERVLGLNHLDTQATKNNMGMVLYNKQKYGEALKIFQGVFNTLQIICPNHPDNLYVKNNVGLVLSNQGKDAEALKIFREVLSSREIILGPEHHECTLTKNNIAQILYKQGKYYEALEVFEEVLDGFNKVLGPENEKTQEVNNIVQSLIVLPEILITIVNNNDFNKLKKSIEKGGNINSKDNNYFTLLHHSVITGNTDMVQFLLRNGADVNQITISKGNTPLHIATSRGLKEIVEILLQHASDNKLNEFINAKTTSAGTTALHVAVKKGSLEIVMSLLKHGAIYDIKNKEGKVPLDFSNDPNISNLLELTAELFGDIKNGNDCIIKKLKELEIENFEAVMKTHNNQGNTLIQVAENHKHPIIAKNLSEILKTRQ